jgi:hypothetical protein
MAGSSEAVDAAHRLALTDPFIHLAQGFCIHRTTQSNKFLILLAGIDRPPAVAAVKTAANLRNENRDKKKNLNCYFLIMQRTGRLVGWTEASQLNRKMFVQTHNNMAQHVTGIAKLVGWP